MKDPLEFGIRGWVLFAAYAVVVVTVMLWLGPEYVAWAFPIASGGALVSTQAAPASLGSAVCDGMIAAGFAVAALGLAGLFRTKR